MRQRHQFTDPQRKWLDGIGTQMKHETVVDKESLDQGRLKTDGGFVRLNKVFDGKLAYSSGMSTPGELSLGTVGLFVLGGIAALALAIAIAVGNASRRSHGVPSGGVLGSASSAPRGVLPSAKEIEVPVDTAEP